jgi:hypothetical protein
MGRIAIAACSQNRDGGVGVSTAGKIAQGAGEEPPESVIGPVIRLPLSGISVTVVWAMICSKEA